MEEYETLLKRITMDPDMLVGKPCIRDMRISVEHILEALASGISPQKLVQEYPLLETDDIRAALLYAKEVVATERVYPVGEQ